MRLFLLLLFVLSGPVVSSQVLNDSLFVSSGLHFIDTSYTSLLGLESPVYKGRRYYNSYGKFGNNGHACFLKNNYAGGNIVYDGLTYSDVRIKYDLIQDQLIILHFDKMTAVTVESQHVDSFSLLNHTFVHIRTDDTKPAINGPEPGYYDLLYDGKIDLLAKRTKAITEKVTETMVESSVSQEDKYYLFRDSVYTEIKSKKNLLKLLRSTQGQNQQFIKANHLNFKRDKENALIELVKFHDSIAQK